MARPLRRRLTRRDVTSRSSPRRAISAPSHLPAEFSCEIPAQECPRAARLPRSRWINCHCFCSARLQPCRKRSKISTALAAGSFWRDLTHWLWLRRYPLAASIPQKEQTLRGKFDRPGLRKITERFPFLLEHLSLQMKIIGIRGRSADAQVERDAKGRFSHRSQPAREHVLGIFQIQFLRRVNADMMRADRDILRQTCQLLRDAQSAAPIESFHASVGKKPRA